MSVAAIVQQRGGGVVRNRHASMPTRTSGGGRWGGRGRPGTGNCPAAGTRADGRGHNGLGRTRQRRVRGRGSHRPAARASADRASEPPSREPPCPPLFHAATLPAAGVLDGQTTRGKQDSRCREGDPTARTRGPPPTWPASRPSRDSASCSFQAAPLPEAGVLDGQTARGGQGRRYRAGDLAARAFGNGTSRRNYEYYCQILTIPL